MKTLISLFAFSLLLWSCSNNEEEYTLVIEPHTLLELPKPIMDSLKGGEIIMRKGGGFMSSQIVKTLNEPVEFSHCGFIVQTDTGLIIIHSLGRDYGSRDGVQPSTFYNFNVDAIDSSLCVVKPKLSDSLLQIVQQTAKEYYDKRYAFDYSFDLTTKDRLHCTEFIHDVLLEATGKEIYPIEKTASGADCLLFKNFFNPIYFETIYSMKKLPEISFDY